MAIIYTYPIKTAADAGDLVLISDSKDKNKTKNTSISSIKDVIDVVDSISAGPGISVSNPTGDVTVGNTGVLSLTAGSNISLSGSTGNITISTSASNVDGSGTTNRIPRWTDSNTLGDSQISQNGSSIGIGAALGTATGSLEVFNGTLNNQLYITCPDTSQAAINFGGTSNKDKGRINYSDNSDVMMFNTNSSEKMRITSAGNIGIGTTNPPTKMAIADADPLIRSINTGLSNTGYYMNIGMFSGRATLDAYTNSNGSAPLYFATGGSNRMQLSATGNLSIGPFPGTEKLNVDGTVDLTNLKVSGVQGNSGDVLTSSGTGISWAPGGGDNLDHWFAGCASVGSSSSSATNPRQASFTFPNEVGSSNFGPCIPIMADIEVMKVAIKWNGSNTPTIGASGTVDFKLGILTNGFLNPDTQEGTVNYTNVANLTSLQITSADSGTWIYKFHNFAGTGVTPTFNSGQVMVVVFPRPAVGWTGTGATNGDLQMTMQVKYI
tara:strand:+ start:1632 stop:3113 length:1482 start_codon:yes stop_codon:yes gene_type:complete